MQTVRKPSIRTQAKWRRLVAEARAAYDGASSAVTTWAIENGHGHGHGHVKWSEFEPIAEREIPALLHTSRKLQVVLDTTEQAAIDAWCAYRGTYGLLFWVHH